MDSDKPNPWDWVSRKCRETEWYSSASIAEFLASVEYDLWGTRNTDRWKDMYMFLHQSIPMVHHKAEFLMAVVTYKDFKVGCVASGYNCEMCSLRKKQGVCNEAGSLTHFWQYVLQQEKGSVLDEEWAKWLVDRFSRWERE